MSFDLEQGFCEALQDAPAEEASWMALADWLEDSGQTRRSELVRLTRELRTLPLLTRSSERLEREHRLVELLRSGVRPVILERSNSLGMRFSLIPSGRFLMGTPEWETDRVAEETPAHEVQITRSFYLGRFPVTQEQYKQVTGINPSHYSSENPRAKTSIHKLDTRSFPVESVSWYDAVSFCRQLSHFPEEKHRGCTYRLPTEAEWEYASRGGACSTMPFYLGSSLTSADANFDGNHPYPAGERGKFLMRPCAVGSYLPNLFGLHDMAGNVWEWCQDWFAEDYYARSPTMDPPGPERGHRRILRGGAFWNWASCLRSARRVRNLPDSREQAYGFRVVLEVCCDRNFSYTPAELLPELTR